MSELIIINGSTGEIVRTVDQEKENVTVRSHKQNEAYQKLIREGKSKSFTFTRMENVKEVTEVLTTQQCGLLLVLSTHIDFNGAIVKPNGEAMNNNEIMQALKLKKSSFHDFMNKCLEAGIITKDFNGNYHLKKEFHFKGKAEMTPLVKVYSTTIRELHKKNKVSDLGVLYKLQSRIHVNRNVLVHNPEERDESRVQFMSRQDVADLLGVSLKQVSVVLNRLKLDGMKVVASIKIGNETRYVMNPELIARNEKVHDETLKLIF